MRDLPGKEMSCWDIDKKGMIVKLLDHKLSQDEEDDLLFHIRHCPACLAVVADVLFARGQVERPKGPDYRVNVN